MPVRNKKEAQYYCFTISGFRCRIFLLFVFISVPLWILIFGTAIQLRNNIARKNTDNYRGILEMVARNQESYLKGGRLLLFGLSQMQLDKKTRVECDGFLNALRGKYPFYASLAVFKPNGDPWCSASPGGPNILYRPYFQEALQSRDYVLSDYIFGSASQKPVQILVYPQVDPDTNEVENVFLVSFDLISLSRDLETVKLPSSSSLVVIDRNGVILLRNPEPEKWIGKSLKDAFLFREIVEGKKEKIDTVGADGIIRSYIYAPLKILSDEPVAYIVLGLPKSIFDKPVRLFFGTTLALLFLCGLLAIVICWVGSHFWLKVEAEGIGFDSRKK
ncbi:MAG: hypothetical protein FJZ05_01450 [Candidatus Nealsonbacteria bacterium]|nr:hypothetical protein [Candidatus Nealsonbacteria bacterium]